MLDLSQLVKDFMHIESTRLRFVRSCLSDVNPIRFSASKSTWIKRMSKLKLHENFSTYLIIRARYIGLSCVIFSGLDLLLNFACVFTLNTKRNSKLFLSILNIAELFFMELETK